MIDFSYKDILSTENITFKDIETIITVAEEFLPIAQKKKVSNVLDGKILATLFYEPSTRTRLSFETAMQRLGGRVINVTGMESSSLMKGETLHDTAKVVENFADIIAVRHPQPGSAHIMADAASIPVINGGDGPHQHPTQALLDIFTIKKERGKLNGLTVAMVGDLKFGRTVHSLSYLLMHYGVRFVFVSPPELAMPDEVVNILKQKGISIEETSDLSFALKKSDVCYMTRIQKERFSDLRQYEKLKDSYILTRDIIEKSNPGITIMHPLPRVNEISIDVDELSGAAYFRQVQNGVAVRMALLALLLGKA